jgi:uncharacterized membrane protein YccC
MVSGFGLALGAALGLLFGTLLTEQSWLFPLVGAIVGLVIGAFVDVYRSRNGSPR